MTWGVKAFTQCSVIGRTGQGRVRDSGKRVGRTVHDILGARAGALLRWAGGLQPLLLKMSRHCDYQDNGG